MLDSQKKGAYLLVADMPFILISECLIKAREEVLPQDQKVSPNLRCGL